MAKPEIEKFVIRIDWPKRLKEDLDYFNVTMTELGKESEISRYRIRAIHQGVIEWKRRIDKMRELTILTLAFNRIIEKRRRQLASKAWLWENNLPDNQ